MYSTYDDRSKVKTFEGGWAQMRRETEEMRQMLSDGKVSLDSCCTVSLHFNLTEAVHKSHDLGIHGGHPAGQGDRDQTAEGPDPDTLEEQGLCPLPGRYPYNCATPR